MDRAELGLRFAAPIATAPVEWVTSLAPVAYEAALAVMDSRVAAIARDEARECVWLLEHPPIYTAGTSSPENDLGPKDLPIFRTGRGGKLTYHGPGQRVAYVMLDLKRRKPDVRAFVAALENWVIATLADFGVAGERREERVGVWVLGAGDPKGVQHENKIAALGIRIRHWISFHGISINVAPNLDHFRGIVPCGIADARFGVTSLAKLGVPVVLERVDLSLRRNFELLFGPTVDGSLAGLPDRPA